VPQCPIAGDTNRRSSSIASSNFIGTAGLEVADKVPLSLESWSERITNRLDYASVDDGVGLVIVCVE